MSRTTIALSSAPLVHNGAMRFQQYEPLTRCREFIERCVVGELEPRFALYQMLLDSQDAEVVSLAIDQAMARHALDEPPVRALARLKKRFDETRELCVTFARLLREEALAQAEPPSNAPSLSELSARLLAEDEEACVPLRTLEPALRERASDEVVAWLRGYRLLAPSASVLYFGCEVVDVAAGIAPHVRRVEAVDASPARVATLRARCAALPNVRAREAADAELRTIEDGSMQLTLAVDTLRITPQGLTHTMTALARVTEVDGHLALVNFACDRPLAEQRKYVAELAKRHGFAVEIAGMQPFALWTGAMFLLRRDHTKGIGGRDSWV